MKAINAKQISRRWYRIIKKERKVVNNKIVWIDRRHLINGKEVIIKANFYRLKHLNTTEIVDHLDELAAAQMNGHTTTAMVRKIYDTKQQQRQHEKIKTVNNPFA